MNIPKLVKIKQYFNRDKISDIDQTVKTEIEKVGIGIRPGANVAITVGSRGIANINLITKAVVEIVKNMGGDPFVVPAMGSHGGATAGGQIDVLKSYGVTEEFIGASIKSSMEVVELPGDGLEQKIYMDKLALSADNTIVVNRIKVHTDFHGPTESGVMKMIAVGLGNQVQAIAIHRHGVPGLKNIMPLVSRQVLKHGNIIMGIGIVENAYDETMIVKAMRPHDIEEEEIKLLAISRNNMPKLPVDNLDILIIDTIGKDISGTGLDTNIIGRFGIDTELDPEKPKIKRIVITDLSDGSHGNSVGMGLADVMTERLKNKIDFHATYENVLTSTFVARGKMPMVAGNDKKAIEYAMRTYGPIEPEKAKIIRIKDTLHLIEMYVSSSVLDELKDKSSIEVVGDFVDVHDENGELIKEW